MNQQRRIVILLIVATLLPMGVLTWLGIRMLEQDRDISRQRRREALEVAAGRFALEIDRRLQEIEEGLSHGTGIQLLPAGLDSTEVPILFQPEAVPEPALPEALAAAEAAEFQQRDPAAVIAAYRRIAASTNEHHRASALVALARVLRHQGRLQEALQVYRDLERLGRVLVSGQPAGLIALQGRCKVYEEMGDAQGIQRSATDLSIGLAAGGWPIDRATFDMYSELIAGWGAPIASADALAGTEAAIELWHAWRRGELARRGRRVVRTGATLALVTWVGAPEHPVVAVTPSNELNAWVISANGSQFAGALSNIDGESLAGTAGPGSISLNPAETRLPFVIQAAFAATPTDESPRGIWVGGGLIITCALMFAAALGVYRATMRESLLARQQTDFVSAVSHEFRTPLTSLRHLTELLTSRGVTSDERRAHYYQLLSNETERLHRMVETLLSFGRIEAGGFAWQLEPVDAYSLVLGVVEEFRRESIAGNRTITTDSAPDVPLVEADREALCRAVWNLLENAVKYSHAPAPIHVSVACDGRAVLLSVDDQGIGVPPSERAHIFQKFVRGSDAKRAGVRGVGIGLALVKHIAEAHGGAVHLESRTGQGSTFTITLPLSGL